MSVDVAWDATFKLFFEIVYGTAANFVQGIRFSIPLDMKVVEWLSCHSILNEFSLLKYFVVDGYKPCVLWPLAQHGLVLWPCRMFHAYAQLFEIPTKEDCWETQYWAQVNRLPTSILLATNFPRDTHQQWVGMTFTQPCPLTNERVNVCFTQLEEKHFLSYTKNYETVWLHLIFWNLYRFLACHFSWVILLWVTTM